jgi:hypothetical protein
MLWILGSAIILGGYRLFEIPEDLPEGVNLVRQVYMIAGSFVNGAQVAALFIFAARLYTRKGPLPREPGHWLLFKSGASCVIGWGTLGLARWIIPNDTANMGLIGISIFIIAISSPAALFSLVALLMQRGEWLWRTFFGVLCLTSVINVLLGALMLVENVFLDDSQFLGGTWGTTLYFQWSSLEVWIVDVPLLVCLCGLLLLDFRAGKRRDWMHFVGVAAEAAVMVLSLAAHFAYAYVLRS